MLTRLRQVRAYLREAFWVRPALLVSAGVLLGWTAVTLDRSGVLPEWVNQVTYAGGASGARGLLSALATSSLSVAGTIFSITIAALSLASAQMGPRLLRTFTRDAGNQLVLGIYLGTFAYALVVLRSIRGSSEGGFVPHLAITLAFVLGLICTGMLVWFVHHAAGSISVEVVIEEVSGELTKALTDTEQPEPEPAPRPDLRGAAVVRATQAGFLQQIDTARIADFAADAGCIVRLLFRPGQLVHLGVPIALVKPEVEGADRVLRHALIVGKRRTLAADPAFAVQQLTDLAVRALSPGINDPGTATSVVDTLTGVLCEMSGRRLPPRHVARGGRMLLCWPAMDYADLVDAIFDPIRQNAASASPVFVHILKGLIQIAQTERDPVRLTQLSRHAELAHRVGLSGVTDPAGRNAIIASHHRFRTAHDDGQPDASYR